MAFTLTLLEFMVAPGPLPRTVQTDKGSNPIISGTQDGLSIDWNASSLQISSLPGGQSRLTMSGFEQLRQPSVPEVPFAAVLVAIPPGANPTLEIRQVDESAMYLPASVAHAGKPEGVLRAPDGQVIGGAFTSVSDNVEFNRPALALEPLGLLRGVSIARLVFYPARPRGSELRLTTHVHAILHFNSPEAAPLLTSSSADAMLERLKSAVVNPQDIQPNLDTGRVSQTGSVKLGSNTPKVAVEVNQTGLTEITYENLSAVGYPVTTAHPNQLHLTLAGKEIAYEWDGDSDTSFEPGERLLFYAAPRFSRYSPFDVYFLEEGNSPGMSMESRSADPLGLPAGVARVEITAEENRIYTPDCFCAPIPPGRDGDRWVWDRLQRDTHPTQSYSIGLAGVDPSQPATLILWLIGFTDVSAKPDHHVQVALNQNYIGQVEWDGKESISAAFYFPGSMLINGSNSLTLSLPGIPSVEVEGAWLDAFSIDYGRDDSSSGESIFFRGEEASHTYIISLDSSQGLRAYDVTDPGRPLRLSGFTLDTSGKLTLGDGLVSGNPHYWITSEAGIANPERLHLVPALETEADFSGADYLIISPAEFVPALDDLISLRQKQGLRVAQEDLQAIYDTFGDGRPDPAAIRNFLDYAYNSWDPRPTYVLLVGDGTSDPKRYNPESSATIIPPYLVDVDPWAGETAADNRYVTVDGDDILPDMLIGRLPANNLAEAQTMVAKIVAYEQAAEPGPWNSHITFVADDPDEGGNFPASSEALMTSFVKPPLVSQRLYYTPPTFSAEEISKTLFQDWNDGTGIIMFTGHASVHQWAAERFIHLEDISALKNKARLPVVLEMTCFTGSFQVPAFPTLDEALLRYSDGGAVAVWGPTGLGVATGHESLAEGFYESIFQGGQRNIGTATLSGKLHLSTQNPGSPDLIDTFTLLGDPATRLNQSHTRLIYLPLVQ